ncbi:MAG: DUF434 domain-containing protein [Planctomycetaceae bacterium]|nr:DUF434 domain-containing protein [Planctomycetaceae bacterium]
MTHYTVVSLASQLSLFHSLMPDTRKHRGPHPQDADLFAREKWPELQRAVAHLSWLLTRGYAITSALKLVGDRFELTDRQRKAVVRSSCSDQAMEHRQSTLVKPESLTGFVLHLDGFNVLTTVEAALGGGVLLLGRDGCLRDMASMHGNYRKVEETRPALELIGQTLAEWQPLHCIWYLDRPVSNSVRLSQILSEVASENGWDWRPELVPDPDAILRTLPEVVVSADSGILDDCQSWLNLAFQVVSRLVPNADVVPLNELTFEQ